VTDPSRKQLQRRLGGIAGHVPPEQPVKFVGIRARRSQVEFASHRGVSVRRACALIGVARSTMGYEPKMPAKDGPVITVMRDLSSQYPRYGYRRIHIFLGRRGHEMSPDRAYRLWQLAGLQVPRKRPRRRVADESFNGKFRDECLSLEWFRNRTEAKIVIENWRRHYNEVRPHSSLSYQTPVEFKSKRSSTNPNGAILQQ
jgi:transposase InsO family protein